MANIRLNEDIIILFFVLLGFDVGGVVVFRGSELK